MFATRDIKAGEEIYLDYGSTYWGEANKSKGEGRSKDDGVNGRRADSDSFDTADEPSDTDQ